MGRLTERCGNTYVPNENANYEPMNCMDKLGRLEDLEEQGRLIELPCAVGDTVWIKGIPVEISFIHIDNEVTYCIQFDCSCCADDCPFYEDEVSWEGEHDCKSLGYMEFKNEDIGKTVFRTKEEAEAKLKELEG